jgi:hypothetical protein
MRLKLVGAQNRFVAAEARMSDDVAGGSLSRLDFILW